MYCVYWNQAAAAYLSLYLFIFLSLQFSDIKSFLHTFLRNCEAYKVGTFYTHGQWVDVSCIPESACYCLFVLLIFIFLSIQFSNLKYFRHTFLRNCETGRGSSIGSDFVWHASGPEFDPHIWHILSWRLGHENVSTAILPLPLIQEEQLSVTGERMCTKY